MKKLIPILVLFTTLISCNNSTSIPEGSIYKKGDKVYKIDSLIYYKELNLTNEAVDEEIIMRPSITNFIFKNNTTGIFNEIPPDYFTNISDSFIEMPKTGGKFHIVQIVNY